MRLHIHTLPRLRITVVPKRWPSRRGYARGLGVHPDVLQELAHLGQAKDMVGGSLPLATGAALACKQQGCGVVVAFFGDAALEESACYEAMILATLWKLPILFFGDGATDAGVFRETLNVASLWQLPLLFVCDNGYAEFTSREEWLID